MRYKKSVYRSLAMVTQLGLCVLTPVLFCIFAGSYIDSHYGTKSLLILLLLGILGGGRGAYLMAKRLIEQDAKEAEQERMEGIKKALESPLPPVSKPKTESRIRTQGKSMDAETSREERE